jgi:transcriptional regulator GlxA family with amidase domain
MKIAILIFDRITALDAIGPYEVLSRLPGAELTFVAKEAGPKRSDTGALAITADAALDELTDPDLLLVPGGIGNRPILRDEEVLDWIRTAHEGTTWTTSVCTGSFVLGAAGILEGLEATTHWAFLERLREYGATPVKRRVVEQGKVWTAAGVSAGLDMALTLAARDVGDGFAQSVQLGIEYDPAPPFDTGSPDKAPPEVVEAVRRAETGEEGTRRRNAEAS